MDVAQRVTDHLHPRLAALSADPSGEAAFWARIAAEKAPLIEPDPAYPGHSLVTYVFRLGAAKHVVMQPGYGGPPDNVMDQVAGTGVCHACYRYRNDVRTTYSFGPDLPPLGWATAGEAEWATFLAFIAERQPSPDPHPREIFVSRAGEGKPDNVACVLALPEALDHAVAEKRDGIARGRINPDRLASAILGNERRIWVYTPPGYDAETPGGYPLLLAFDGGAALTVMPTHRILDNLIADGAIPPMVAVLVDNATDTSRNDELPCNEDFARFLETELLPWVAAGYNVTTEARRRFVTGVSYGGLASLWIGFQLSHLFGNVLSQAASLWWGPGTDPTKPGPAQTFTPEWLIEQYAAAPRLPLRIWQEIGLMEDPGRMLEPNRKLRAILEAKGYDLTYREFAGGHDYALWRTTLPLALAAMAPAPTG